jgi:hypothetical protein
VAYGASSARWWFISSDLKHPRRRLRGTSMFALRTQRLLAPLSRNALPRLSCARQLCTPSAKPEEPADDGQPKLLYEGGKNKVLLGCIVTAGVHSCALQRHGLALAEVLCAGRRR